MRRWKESPCTGCNRVKKPDACDNKECKLWRKWFLTRWEQMRTLYSGKTDPCSQCDCLRELCTEPCGKKRAWEKEPRE